MHREVSLCLPARLGSRGDRRCRGTQRRGHRQPVLLQIRGRGPALAFAHRPRRHRRQAFHERVPQAVEELPRPERRRRKGDAVHRITRRDARRQFHALGLHDLERQVDGPVGVSPGDAHGAQGVATRPQQHGLGPHRRGNSAYSKRVTHINKTADWEACTPRQVDYYAKNGELLKQEVITWQKIEDAWVWETAVMHNVQTGVSATYQMLETEVNISLPDAVFSERQLRRGYPEP